MKINQMQQYKATKKTPTDKLVDENITNAAIAADRQFDIPLPDSNHNVNINREDAPGMVDHAVQSTEEKAIAAAAFVTKAGARGVARGMTGTAKKTFMEIIGILRGFAQNPALNPPPPGRF